MNHISFNEIKKIEFYNTFLIFPNGLKIILLTGKTEKFAVWKRSLVVNAIHQKFKT